MANQLNGLPLRLDGTGESKGYELRQICSSIHGFIYEKEKGGTKHYEVFKRRVNVRFGNVTYPSSKAFGKWAWTTSSLERATNIFCSFTDNS